MTRIIWPPRRKCGKTATQLMSDPALDQELVDAAFVCDFTRVKNLLERGADPNARDDEQRTPLFSAILGNHVGLVGLLIESGADLNARDDQGFTPLHFAAQEYLPQIAYLLLAKGANVNALDEDGGSPLWRAVFCARGRYDLIQLLRKHGAKDDLPNNEGVTPRALAERLGLDVFTVN